MKNRYQNYIMIFIVAMQSASHMIFNFDVVM